MPESASKRLLKRRAQLISSFFKNDDPSFLEKHAYLFDDYFSECFDTSDVGPRMNIAKNPYAIVALGGYGRKEQCIHSDVDILFLFKKAVSPEAETLIQEMIYPLWDAGFEVGHVTRTIKECVALAGDDIEVLMAMLDSRFICGISQLFFDMHDVLQKKVIRSRSRKILDLLVEENQQRHIRFGDSSYLLEPNLKEGRGGLRDFHTMLWVGRIKSDVREPRDLAYTGHLSELEYESLTEALLFIRKVRNYLHRLSGRKCDQLHLEYQVRIANQLKYKKKNGQKAVERFLGDLHAKQEEVKQRHLIFLSELGYGTPNYTGKRIFSKQTNIPGLDVNKRNMLTFSSVEAVMQSPELLIKIFLESARLKAPLSATAKRIEKDLVHLIDDEFRVNTTVIQVFEKILLAPPIPFNVLDEMLSTGFLPQFIPEFKTLLNRIQYNEYHIFPVDKHVLKAVHIAKQFGDISDDQNDALYSDLYQELNNKKILLWACLLHDIGKGVSGDDHSGAGAVIAEKILQRMKYGQEDIDAILFLIREHLYLIKTATRRDIQDEETAVMCARKIGNEELLQMLYLLTVADSMSTGPKAWNSWTSGLLRELFLKVSKILKRGELATTEAVRSVEQKKSDLEKLWTHKNVLDVEAFFRILSLRYLLYVPVTDIAAHSELHQRLKDKSFVWDVQKDETSDARIVTICAKNKPGLFSRIAGVFTLNNLNILDAQIYTWKNNVALDIFHVTPPPDQIFEEEHWSRAEKALDEALSYSVCLDVRLDDKICSETGEKFYTHNQSPKVIVDNESSSFFTIIEVFTYDFTGLLFRITDALFRCGLDIYVAKIATHVDQVVDIFYVRNLYGEKVDAKEQVDEIKTAVGKCLQKANSTDVQGKTTVD